MGAALVTRLLKAAYDVAVYRRTHAKAEALAALEAAVVDSPTGLADRDVVFTMVSGPADLLDVTCGEGGVLTAGAAPGVLVNSSTVSAEVSAMVRAAASAVGTAFLAAPVSGNPKVAHSGHLTLAVSGGGDVRL
jgi:3-hydroxyisobutyrate dehydrogenase